MIIEAWGDLRPDRYDVLSIDCPWTFKAYSGPTDYGRTSEAHYPVLDLAELAKLPINDLCAKNALVFVWAVGSQLDTTIELAKHWGLTFVNGGLTWAKTNRKVTAEPRNVFDRSTWFLGMGFYMRGNTEYALLFKKGRPKIVSRAVPQILVAPVGKHSAKPDEAQLRMEWLVEGDEWYQRYLAGEQPPLTKSYLEVFARRERPGWDCIGNELGNRRDIREVLSATV